MVLLHCNGVFNREKVPAFPETNNESLGLKANLLTTRPSRVATRTYLPVLPFGGFTLKMQDH